jgi:hypothetical protein
VTTVATIGCSFVWGDELIGHDQDPPTHWDSTFGAHLRRELGFDKHVNLACCGNGNAKIFRDLIQYLSLPKKEDPDVLVVMWSAWKRIELFEAKESGFEDRQKIKREQQMTQFSPVRYAYLNKDNSEIAGMWSTLVNNNQTGIIQTLAYMSAIQQLCDARGIKIVQTVFHTAMGQQLLDAFFRDVPDTDVSQWRNWVYEAIWSLRPECTLGIRFLDAIDEAQKDDLEYKVYIKDGRVKNHKGKAIRDDNGHFTLYELGVEKDDIAKYGHPKELSHELYAKSLAKIIKEI